MIDSLDAATPWPAAIPRLLAQVGPRWHTDIARYGNEVKAAYLPLQLAAPREGCTLLADVRYGPDERHRLDVFTPAAARGAPVVMFVHGGAFVRGDKTINEGMYANVLHWFARQGFIGINVEYRLAPQAPWPGGAQDVARAVAWTHEHCESWGGDPDRLFLVGHSAGGTHAASYACDPALGHGGKHLRGLVLLSARLRVDVLPENPNAPGVRAYFGDDPGMYDARSPVTHAAASTVPVFIAFAEFENPLLDVYALEFALATATARRRAPRLLRMRGHNHVSLMAHFNTGEEMLGREIVDFCATLT